MKFLIDPFRFLYQELLHAIIFIFKDGNVILHGILSSLFLFDSYCEHLSRSRTIFNSLSFSYFVISP